MKDGYIQQIGTPKEIYNSPSNIFVATFIGAPAMNMIRVHFEKNKISMPNEVTLPVSKAQLATLEEEIKKDIIRLSTENRELMEENNVISLPKEEQTDKLYKSMSFRKRIPDIIALNEEKIKANEERITVLEGYLKNKSFDAILGIRPEDIVSETASKILDTSSKTFPLFIKQAELLGNEYYVYSEIDEKKVIAKVSANEEVTPKVEKKFAINLNNIHLFDKDSEKRMF